MEDCMAETVTAFDPRQRSSYRRFTTIPIRFADQDILGHVNNAAIAVYFEHARCEHLIPRLASPAAPHLNIVLARIVIDYLKEIRYPGTVDIGIRVTHTGTKSFVISGGIFLDDVCCAISQATIVFFDTQTRRATEPTDNVRARIAELK
jgi:acyl-CoA thioester hydrolase